MSDYEIIPAHPLPDDIVDIMRYEQKEQGSVPAYQRWLQAKYQHSALGRGLKTLSQIVEPVDRSMGIDEHQPRADAFYVGSLLGLRAVSFCVENMEQAFKSIKLELGQASDAADDLEARHVLASEVMTLGQQSYAVMEEVVAPLFDEWDGQLFPDIRQHLYLHSGFGLPVAYLFMRIGMNEEAEKERDLAAMQQTLDNPESINWDDLDKLLEDQ